MDVPRVFHLARVRAAVFMNVVDLDVAKAGHHTVAYNDVTKRSAHIWREEEYQQALGRIRDYGIMNGLDARTINETFRIAHADAARGVYK
jgi:hypothetical protein